MKISVILGHPDPGSFNHALAAETVKTLGQLGQEVFFHDLCAEGFDPLLPASEFGRDAILSGLVKKHCGEIAAADGIVIIHPNWWGMPPAVMTGWVDRVIRPGVAYRFIDGDSGEGVPKGLLRAKTAIVLNTSNTPEEREERVFGDPLQRIWKDCVFNLCGVKDFRRHIFRVVVTSTLEERRQWLAETAAIIREAFQ